MFCFPALNIPHVKVDDTKFNTEYANVFVHGLAAGAATLGITISCPIGVCSAAI